MNDFEDVHINHACVISHFPPIVDYFPSLVNGHIGMWIHYNALEFHMCDDAQQMEFKCLNLNYLLSEGV